MADPRARFLITADDRATRALKRVRGELSGLSSAAKKLSTISIGGFLSGVGVGGLTALATRSIEAADAIGKTADRLGLGVEAYQEYAFAAEQSGVSVQQFNQAIQRLGRRFAEADKGTGEAVNAFKELGIATRDANGNLKSLEDLLPELADKLGGVEDELERNRLAQKLLDSEGVALVNLFDQQSAGLERLRQRIRDAGGVLREDLVRGAEEANSELQFLSRVVSTQVTTSVLEAAPAIIALTQAFANLTTGAANALTVTGRAAGELVAKIVEGDRTIDEYRRTQIEPIERDIQSLENDLADPRAFYRTEEQNEDLRKQIRLLEQKRDAIRDGLADTEKQAELQKEVNDAVSGVSSRTTRTASGVTPLQRKVKPLSQAKRISDAELYIKTLQRQADTLGLTNAEIVEYELRLRGATEQQVAFARSLQEEVEAYKAIEAEELKNIQIMEESRIATESYREELERFADSLNKSINPAEQLEEELIRIDAAFEAGLISAEVWGEATFDAIERSERAVDGFAEEVKKVKPLSEELGLTFASAFEDAIVEGQELSDVLKSLEKDIVGIVTRQLVTKPLADELGKILQPASGAVGNFFSRILPFAAGGSINSGTLALVGEKGPELFVPDQNGTIMNARQTAAAMARTVTINVNGVKDPEEFRRSMPQIQRQAQRLLAGVN